MSKRSVAGLVFIAFVLPAFTCGVGPVLRNLILRVDAIEDSLGAVEEAPLLVDADGSIVGKVLQMGFMQSRLYVSAMDAQVTAEIRVDDRPPFIVLASTTEFRTILRSLPTLVTYETTDCSGTEWIGPPDSFWAGAYVAGPENTVYMGDTSARPEKIIVRSMRHRNHPGSLDDYQDCYTSEQPALSDRDVIPVIPVLSLDEFVTLPLHIE